MEQNKVRKQCIAWAVLVGGLTVGTTTATASQVDFIAFNLQGSPVFDASAGLDGEWDMPAAATNYFDGTVLAGPDVYFVNPSSFAVAGQMDWTGNGLAADLSAGGRANGLFGPGGTFSLTGTLYDSVFTPVFTGVLVAGTVSSFQVQETSTFADAMDVVVDPLLTPTSGVLVDGTFAEMLLPYRMRFSLVGIAQNGGELLDFQSSMASTIASQFVIDTPVIPEPASLLLTIVGAGLLIRRRR